MENVNTTGKVFQEAGVRLEDLKDRIDKCPDCEKTINLSQANEFKNP